MEKEGKIYFNNADEFNEFMVKNKPREIYFDDFNPSQPYIQIDFNDGTNFRGSYTGQCLLGGNNGNFRWLYEPGLYIKPLYPSTE